MHDLLFPFSNTQLTPAPRAREEQSNVDADHLRVPRSADAHPERCARAHHSWRASASKFRARRQLSPCRPTGIPTCRRIAGPPAGTIHDFYGFPDALYKLRYDAPGAPRLREGGQAYRRRARSSSRPRSWSPGCQLCWAGRSRHPDLPAVGAAALGPHTTSLSDGSSVAARGGVLVMGSGSAIHNLRALVRRDDASEPEPWRRLSTTGWPIRCRRVTRFRSPTTEPCPLCSGGPSDRRALLAAARRLRRRWRGRPGQGASSQLHTLGNLSMAAYAFG